MRALFLSFYSRIAYVENDIKNFLSEYLNMEPYETCISGIVLFLVLCIAGTDASTGKYCHHWNGAHYEVTYCPYGCCGGTSSYSYTYKCCSSYSTTSTAIRMAGGISGLIILAIAFLIIGVCCCKRKLRNNRAMTSRPSRMMIHSSTIETGTMPPGVTYPVPAPPPYNAYDAPPPSYESIIQENGHDNKAFDKNSTQPV